MIDLLLSKRNEKYDLIFYDNIYSRRFSPHLLDLYDYLDDDHIILYDREIILKSCVYNYKLVGLPVMLDYSVLYSNIELLNKYNKEIPKTWDELYDTGKYIMEEEIKRNNNTDLIIYNGLFTDTEIGTCSLYEFIYSYRDRKDSSFPELTSETAINALKMIKKIKNDLSSDSQFKTSWSVTLSKIRGDFSKILFLKYWYTGTIDPVIKTSALPGLKEGISGSTIGGYNLGINRYINDENRKAAIRALKYITSKEVQRKAVIEKEIFSLISSLYEEEAVCLKVDCNFFRAIQPVARPTYVTEDYSSYSEQFREHAYEYLYGDKTAKEVLKNIEDITKIYQISLSSKDSLLGLLYLIIFSVISTIMLLSLSFLFMEKYELCFSFLPKTFWVFIILGLIIMMCESFTLYGELNTTKCHLRPIILSYGYTLHFVPVLYKLLINFPEENSISIWISENKYIFMALFILLDTILSVLAFISPYDVNTVIINNGLNYLTCDMSSKMGLIINYLSLIYKGLIMVFVLFFIFLEWNIQKTYFDIRCLISTVLIDFLSFIFLVILICINLKEYYIKYAIHFGILVIFSVSNFISLYIIKILR